MKPRITVVPPCAKIKPTTQTSRAKNEGSVIMRRVSRLFFFQAEDGIRDYKVTGVQTCALPIFGFVNLLIADFEKANWTASGLARYVPALVPRAQAIQPQLHALKVYFNGTCNLGEIGRASCRERV